MSALLDWLRPSLRGGLLAVLLMSATAIHAQPAPASVIAAQTNVQPLPSLDVVLDAARQHSPRLRLEAASVQRSTAALRGLRASWLQNLTVGVSTNYGSTGNATLDAVTLGTQATAGVRLSLYDLFGRRHDVRAQEAVITQAREQEAMAQLDEDRLVTQLYHEVALAERLVGVRSEALQAARSHYAVAERGFSQGHLTIAALAEVTEVKAAAEATYEAASADYRNAYAQLELVVGTSLRALADQPVAAAEEPSDPENTATQPHSTTAAPDSDTAAPPHRDTDSLIEDDR